MRKHAVMVALLLVASACSGNVETTAPVVTSSVATTTAAVSTTTVAPTTSAAPTTTVAPTTTTVAPTTTTPEAGSRSNPVRLGDGHDLANGWSLALTGVRHDATEEIAAANMFNDPPEPGRQFVLVDLIVAYNGLEDPRSPFLYVSFDAVGQGNVGYDSFGCGVLPNDLDSSRDVFSGGSLSGQICFDVDSSDADSLVLYASAGLFSGEDIFFSLFEESESPTGVSTRIGPVDGAASSSNRSGPNPTGTSALIGGGWVLVVNGSNPDGTAEVMAENQFNDPPPDGHVFFLIEVVLTNEGLEKQDSAFFVDIGAVGDGNVEYDAFGCGVIPNELDTFTELFPGGSVSGDVCFVVPESEAGSDVVVYASGEVFGDEMVYFATD